MSRTAASSLCPPKALLRIEHTPTPEPERPQLDEPEPGPEPDRFARMTIEELKRMAGVDVDQK